MNTIQENQISKIGFGNSNHEVREETFWNHIKENNYKRYDRFMDSYWFQDNELKAYTIHGFMYDSCYIVRGENEKTVEFVKTLL